MANPSVPGRAVLGCQEYGKSTPALAVRISRGDDEWALHTAAVTGNTEVVHQLIEAGSDVNICDTDGLTPLHLAAWRGHLDACLVLLQSRADPSAVDNQVKTIARLAHRFSRAPSRLVTRSTRQSTAPQGDQHIRTL
eukprot:3019842-Pyramimonas_sp.AAC.2